MKPIVAAQLFELARERVAKRCRKRDARPVQPYCQCKPVDRIYRKAGGSPKIEFKYRMCPGNVRPVLEAAE